VFDYDVVLLDEPTSNLDLHLEKTILKEIFEHCKGKTILVISHRPFVLDYVDRVLVMRKGEVSADGTLEDVRGAIAGLD
jgi:ATP-binding cassette subfamily C protein LapB